MRMVLAITFAAILITTARVAEAQQADTAANLVSTWTLVAVERESGNDESTRLRSVRGLLVLDGAGNVFEFFSTASREQPEAPQIDPQRALENFGGFWGQYEIDQASSQITFVAKDGVSPSVRGLTFDRRYDLNDDYLILTSTREPQAQGNTRWTWQRVPTVENLSPAYREVVGFWQHVEERRVDTSTGEVQNVNRRAPSVIVYTPGGFVGVHFPSLGREAFATESPTDEEAEAAIRGYLGYFGALSVYPGEVSHNVLSGVSPATGSILRRYAAISADELVVTLQSTMPPTSGERPRLVTEVVLHRLSGADAMLPNTQ